MNGIGIEIKKNGFFDIGYLKDDGLAAGNYIYINPIHGESRVGEWYADDASGALKHRFIHYRKDGTH